MEVWQKMESAVREEELRLLGLSNSEMEEKKRIIVLKEGQRKRNEELGIQEKINLLMKDRLEEKGRLDKT
jgi:diketogulonate reductase-like aldo/keto reductase